MVKYKNSIVKFKSIYLFLILFANLFFLNKASAQEYIVGGDFDYSPFSFIDKTGKACGVDVDILNAISLEMNIDFSFQLSLWDEALINTQSGEVDVITGIIFSEEREGFVDFTYPIHTEYYSIFVRANVHFEDVLNLNAYRLVVLKDDISIEKYLKPMGLYKNYLIANSFPDALAKIEQGVADYVIAPHFLGMQEVEGNKYENIKIEGPPLLPSIYCMAVKKGDSLLLNILNQGILKLRDNGELLKLQSKWKVYERDDLKYSQLVKYIGIIILVVILIVILVFVWNLLLRARIRKKTFSLKLKNHELCKSEEKFRIITENSSDIIWHMDSNFRTTYISPADERIRGFKTETVIGSYLWSILKPEGIELLKKANDERIILEKTGVKSVPVIYELEHICKDGNWIWVEATATPCYDENGEISGYHGVTRDISERKKTEEALVESELRLRISNAEKDKFFTIIAHDLKSPFNSIISYSDLLTKNIKKNNFQDLEKFSLIINNSSKKAMDLLSNLMDWALSQTGRLEFNPVHFDIYDVLVENVFLFEDIARRKSIIIKNMAQENLFVYADKRMVNTVLRNLISNAIKFTSKDGSIEILAKIEQGKVEVGLSDTGIGLSAEAIEKLFRSDVKNIIPKTEDKSGNGLGLILCKEFVGIHQEKIWIESKLGKGSTFYFTMPYSPN